MKIAENEMVKPLVKGLIDQGFWSDRDPALSEVPLGRKRIDIVVCCRQKVIAIELKVRDWRRALYQSFINQLVADHVYVAIWEKCVSEDLLREAKELGIGVISVSAETALELHPAKRAELTCKTQRENIYDFLHISQKRVGDLPSLA